MSPCHDFHPQESHIIGASRLSIQPTRNFRDELIDWQGAVGGAKGQQSLNSPLVFTIVGAVDAIRVEEDLVAWVESMFVDGKARIEDSQKSPM